MITRVARTCPNQGKLVYALLGSPPSPIGVVFCLFAIPCLGGQCSFKSAPGELDETTSEMGWGSMGSRLYAVLC